MDGRDWAIRSVPSKEGRVRGIAIPQLECLIEDSVVDLLKVDIEGSEFEVFKTREAFEFLQKRVKLIAIEVHPELGNSNLLLTKLEAIFKLHQEGDVFLGENKWL